MSASEAQIEIAERGRWRHVPALVDGRDKVFVRGRWLRTAVLHEEDWTGEPLGTPEQWASELRRRRIGNRRADVLAFSQKLPATEPAFPYRWEPVSVAALRVESFDAWWTSLPQETRKNVRRAQRRGVTVEVRPLDDGLVRGIRSINDECPVVQGKRSRHYGKSLEETRKDQESFLDRSSFICAYFGGELIGYMKLVRCGAFASVLTTLTRPSHQDKRPANAIVARAVQLCAEEGIPYLVYGMLNYGKKRDGSLREFKVRNSFGEILLPRYFVPLTLRGRIAVALGLHRGLLGILPSWAISLAVALRHRWRAWTTPRSAAGRGIAPLTAEPGGAGGEEPA